MGTILLQDSLSLEQVDLLLKEFPQYLFLSISEEGCRNLIRSEWEKIEIFFGTQLSIKEFSFATQLRWIHIPNDDNNGICLNEIDKRGNVLISSTEIIDVQEAGRFVTTAILAFSKHFFHWKDASKFPGLIWESKWKNSMWDLSKKLLLQVGPSETGLEVRRQCKEFGMKVWGVQAKRTFQPYCDKTIAISNLHSVLPNADVVVLSLPKDKKYYGWFGAAEIGLLKEDSILIIVGSNRAIDEKALAAAAKHEGRFRGIVIDNYSATPIPASSPLWNAPNIMITPNIASIPTPRPTIGFEAFRYNLRQYLHNNFTEMHNVMNFSPEWPSKKPTHG